MKILVPSKRVPDPDEDLQLRDDSVGIDEDDLTYVLNPFDAIALEEAIRWREERDETLEVVAVGLGDDGATKELRYALGMGADRAIHVATEQCLDSWSVARGLAAVVSREEPDLVLMGKQAVDDDANQAGQFLAALLGWPQATFASRIEPVDGGYRVHRETDRGIEVIVVKGRAVITTDLRLNEPRYVSLPAQMKAKKKPIETLSLEKLSVSVESKLTIVEMEKPSSRRECTHVGDVEALIAKLRDEAKVI